MAQGFRTNNVKLGRKTIAVELPLLHRLHELDAEISDRFPREAYLDQGLGRLGLILAKRLEPSLYDWCAPRNALTFAHTGGGGTHFNLLVRENRLDESSPVVVTVPGGGGPWDSNFVVGANLTDFVRFGLLRRFFAMKQFAYQRDVALAAYGSAKWEPTESWHASVGFVPDDEQRAVMRFVGEHLGLPPLTYTPKQFEQLQKRFAKLLELPDEDDD